MTTCLDAPFPACMLACLHARIYARMLAGIHACLCLFLHLGTKSCRIASTAEMRKRCDQSQKKWPLPVVIMHRDAKIMGSFSSTIPSEPRNISQSAHGESHDRSPRPTRITIFENCEFRCGTDHRLVSPILSLDFSHFVSVKPCELRHNRHKRGRHSASISELAPFG